MTSVTRFDFGTNWQAFSEKRGNLQRLSAARSSLQSLLQRDAFEGLRFLDVGCGSGLFSIAAHQLRAAKVVGIDINAHCVAVSSQNRDRFAPGAPIEFRQASILDSKALQPLGEFDIVYAWGSLHHTGALWDAVRNAAAQTIEHGLLVLAIYNKHITSPVWKWIKWIFNRLPRSGKWLMAVFFAGVIYLAKFLVTGRNPLAKERGMDFWYDVIDWVGGFPYEYAAPQEVIAFVQGLGFILNRSVPAQVPTGCNEFVFERARRKDFAS
jgi:2-polyprenyl-3-methyl-5-hydroxy-6-metoxy-1,4-benzoquinol methylase